MACSIGFKICNPLIASLLLAGAVTPGPCRPQHFVVEDTTRYCSVIDTMPSKASDLKIVGDRQGYGSKDQAEQALKGMSGCKAQG